MTQDQKIIRAKVGLLELKGAGLTNWSLRKPGDALPSACSNYDFNL
jgi:hypothetical protein